MSRLRRRNRGSVLLFVVWMVALLSLLAVALGGRGFFALGIVDRLQEQLRASWTAFGGVQYALSVMALDETPSSDSPYELWYRLDDWAPLRDPTVVVELGQGLSDEDRKINLNTAPERVLVSLFAMAQQSPRQAQELAQAVEDWRDEDHDEREYGAEGYYYRGLEHGYDCKDGPFENVEEFLLVKGVTPQLRATVAPWVTVYGSGRLNLNTADETALAALGLTPLAIRDILAYRAGDDRAPGTVDDQRFVSPEAVVSELETTLTHQDVAQLSKLLTEKFLGVGSEAFRIAMTATAHGSHYPVHLSAVVTRHGQIVEWTED